MELSNTALGPSASLHSSFGAHLLDVRDLAVSVRTDSALRVSVLQAVNFHVDSGEVVGILGESGAGKSTLALALLRLLPASFQIVGGTIWFEKRSLESIRERELRKIRGARISLIHQDTTVLNPVIRVGEQVVEVLRAHSDWSKQRCREETKLLLKEVDLEDIDRIYASYPHQLSGGQRQRIVIAQALACRPVLVIADEPTASLDSTTATSIVELLGRLNRQFGIAFLVISHDLKTLERLSDRVMVMYAGRIVEQGPSPAILREPLHPYTRALVSCALPEDVASHPRLARPAFRTIAGSVDGRYRPSFHCQFESRCPDRSGICGIDVPKDFEVADAHTVSCFKFGSS